MEYTISQITTDVKKMLEKKYSSNEIDALLFLIYEKTLKLSRLKVLAYPDTKVLNSEYNQIIEIIKRLNQEEPIQYILGEAFFFGRSFKVNPAVLIPRPETELLIHEILNNRIGKSDTIRILDIGTGSGCIAISLALEIRDAKVTATDISPSALNCAKENDEELTETFDLIVSNPPYISSEEKNSMKPNVLEHEPHIALFAPESDLLIFYKKIIDKSKNSLSPNGTVWFEINERFGKEVLNLLKNSDFLDSQIIKDISGKDRIAVGRKSN